jgi:hypothetical protein
MPAAPAPDEQALRSYLQSVQQDDPMTHYAPAPLTRGQIAAGGIASGIGDFVTGGPIQRYVGAVNTGYGSDLPMVDESGTDVRAAARNDIGRRTVEMGSYLYGMPGASAAAAPGEALLGAGRVTRAPRYAPLGGEVNLGVDAPVSRATQTVRDPYRMMYPGIYANPREIATEAASRVAPENPAMQQLWGVTRDDLDQIARGRVGNMSPQGVIPSVRPRGSLSAQNVMIPQNEQRLIDILGEGGKYPGLAHADAWYVMDPVYQRLEQMFGPQEAVQRYRQLNTMTGMASPGSDVLTELQRGTAAHWLANQGRFADFMKYGGTAEAARGASFPEDMRYIAGHPYHKTSQAGPMSQYLERGQLQSEAPKVPLYVEASGVPQTGFQTTAPVGDAHFSRGVGLADTRKGPTDVGASFSRPEYETLAPWWREKVAAPVGIEAVPAQARLWTVLGPQTGVDSPLGQGKLELFSQQIVKAASRLGVTPQTARDLILSGGAGAGALAALVPGMGSLAAQDRYQPE